MSDTTNKENPYANISCHKCEQNSDSMASCTCTKFEQFEKENMKKTAEEILAKYHWTIDDSIITAMEEYAALQLSAHCKEKEDAYTELKLENDRLYLKLDDYERDACKEKEECNDWTQQDLTFKVADRLDSAFDIMYQQTTTYVNAYDIESNLSSIIESLGLQLVIVDRDKFNSTLGSPFEI